MKLHIVTVGKPKLEYARAGWAKYLTRLERLHNVRVTQLADKYAYDVPKLLEAVRGSYIVALEIQGTMLDSPQLASFLERQAVQAKEVSFMVGGPEGLPEPVRTAADFQWSLSRLTLPHDMAMVVMLEALYRASAITVGLPYHK